MAGKFIDLALFLGDRLRAIVLTLTALALMNLIGGHP